MSTAASRARGSKAKPRETLDFTLTTFLPYRLNVLAEIVSQGLARTYAERFGIGVSEWRVLATVGEFGSVTAKAIGQHAHMGKVKVSRATAELEARGLIARQRNLTDLREAFIVLTPSGLDMYATIVPLARDYVRRLETRMTEEERDVLARVFEKLTTEAEDMSASATAQERHS